MQRWLRVARGSRSAAIVLGGSINGLSFVRSLGRRGVPTLLLDSEPLIGMYTRHGVSLTLPPADEHAQIWVEFLLRIGAALETPAVLFATSDVHSVLLADDRDTVAPYFHFLVPSSATVEVIVNKRAQYELAARQNVPIPRSFFPESRADLNALEGKLDFPCILKPYKAHVGRKAMSGKVMEVRSFRELVGGFEQFTRQGILLMAQEIIPGEDSDLFGYLAFWDANGDEVAWLTKRKLRQNPPHFGDGSLQVTVEATEVAELSRRLLRALKYTGFVGAEFKRDARNGRFCLMEINPRTVSGNQLAISAGVDFPWIGYRYLTDQGFQRPSPTGFTLGVTYVNEEWDFKAFLALRRVGQLNFPEWVRSIRGARARAIGAWDDPVPLLVVVWRLLYGAIRKFFHRQSVLGR